MKILNGGIKGGIKVSNELHDFISEACKGKSYEENYIFDCLAKLVREFSALYK